MTDSELVRQSLSGRASAYEELVRRWSARVLSLCHAKIGHAHAAEDLAQETLLRGFRGLATLKEPEKFGSWLQGIATRVCLDWLKSKQTHQVCFASIDRQGLSEPMARTDAGPGQNLEDAEELRLLLDEIAMLPELFREVILLYYYQEVTYQDLALALGVSAATVNSRLTKARALLRERMISARR